MRESLANTVSHFGFVFLNNYTGRLMYMYVRRYVCDDVQTMTYKKTKQSEHFHIELLIFNIAR